MSSSRDWLEWHRAYEDPDSFLSQRLAEVTTCVRRALDAAGPGRISLLSLCAGEGRDVIGALRDHPRAGDVDGCLVELHPVLAERAERAVADAGLRLEVRRGDAGDPARFADRLPADLLLLVGIFGNITDADVRNTIGAVPSLCRPAASVIWTRRRYEPDLTPSIRGWFDAAGCRAVSFESPGLDAWSVGVERVERVGRLAGPDELPARLFTFVDDLPAR